MYSNQVISVAEISKAEERATDAEEKLRRAKQERARDQLLSALERYEVELEQVDLLGRGAKYVLDDADRNVTSTAWDDLDRYLNRLSVYYGSVKVALQECQQRRDRQPLHFLKPLEVKGKRPTLPATSICFLPHIIPLLGSMVKVYDETRRSAQMPRPIGTPPAAATAPMAANAPDVLDQLSQLLPEVSDDEILLHVHKIRRENGGKLCGMSVVDIAAKVRAMSYRANVGTRTNVSVVVDEEESDDECSICTESMSNSGLTTSLDGCQHRFHKDCIKQWLDKKKDCPLCR